MTNECYSIDQAESGTEAVSAPRGFDTDYEINLIDVLTHLAYRKRLIAKVTGTAALMGLVLSFLLPVRYTATTRIMPPQQTQSAVSILMNQLAGMNGSPLAAMTGGGLGLKNPNDIYIGLLTSRTIADAIIQRFGLARVYRSGDMTEARKRLAGFTEVASEKNGFIVVSVTDEDKGRAAEIANAYTDELRRLTKSLAVTEATQRRLFYEDQLKQQKEALAAAAAGFQEVQQHHGLIQLDAQAKAMIEGLAAARAQIAAKQVEVEAIRSYSTEKNPDVQLSERELAALQSEEARLEQRNHASGIAGLGLGNVPGAGLEYLRAQHELLYQQALYDMLMKQYEAARLDESKEATIIQVVEPAIQPDHRTSPKRAVILLISTLGGFLTGCTAALILWWRELLQFDPRALRQLQQLRSALTGREH